MGVRVGARWRGVRGVVVAAGTAALVAGSPAAAAPFLFSTGNSDGKMALGSRPLSGGVEVETGDDFVLGTQTSITGASFTGLLPAAASLSTVQRVVVEIYRVFPSDSDATRTSGSPTFGTSLVPTRVNSPSDVVLATRDSATGGLSFTASLVTASFTTNNSVLAGINPRPNQTTGGEGALNGEEVQFNVTLVTPLSLPADHYFFVPQVQLSAGNFAWLSAPRPIVSPGIAFAPDLQPWIRNTNLVPDWLRVGTDIVGGVTPPAFNGTFSLSGATCPTAISVSAAGTLEGAVGTAYSNSLAATGGRAPYAFSATGGLPDGVSLTSGGELSGTPTRAGSFPVTLTATDADGCQGSAGLTLHVLAPATQPPASSSPPVISSAHLSHRMFRAAGTRATSTRARRVPVGTTVTYLQSVTAVTTLTVVRVTSGHRRGGRCVAGPPGRHRRGCSRPLTVGAFTHADAPGGVTVPFNGRLRGRGLAPGRYRLTLTPRAGGQTGRTVTLPFRVVR
ncbi:MAG: Ig domain-containing protein [Thermoleophilia bacterium]